MNEIKVPIFNDGVNKNHIKYDEDTKWLFREDSLKLPTIIRGRCGLGKVDKNGNIHFDFIEIPEPTQFQKKIDDIKWKMYNFLEWVLEFGKKPEYEIPNGSYYGQIRKPTRLRRIQKRYNWVKYIIWSTFQKEPPANTLPENAFTVTPMEKPVNLSHIP